MRGRKRESATDHRQRGTFRKHRHAARLEADLAGAIPPPPADLSKGAKQVWNATCEKLLAEGILSPVDTDLIELYAFSVDLAQRATADIAANGLSLTDHKGRPYRNPAAAVLAVQQRAIIQIADRFGLSPYARAQLAAYAEWRKV